MFKTGTRYRQGKLDKFFMEQCHIFYQLRHHTNHTVINWRLFRNSRYNSDMTKIFTVTCHTPLLTDKIYSKMYVVLNIDKQTIRESRIKWQTCSPLPWVMSLPSQGQTGYLIKVLVFNLFSRNKVIINWIIIFCYIFLHLNLVKLQVVQSQLQAANSRYLQVPACNFFKSNFIYL